jgi:hypothetical protein
MSTLVEGGCLCGAVRYQAEGASLARTLCHCRSCRLASGAPTVAWAVFRSDQFRFTAGSPASFRSSPGVTRTFCGACGTPLTYQRSSAADTIDVTTATLDRADDHAPTMEIWVEHRLAWQGLNMALKHYARSSVGASPI